MTRQPLSPARRYTFEFACFALAASVSCGGSATWSPPPAPVIPVAPGPDPVSTTPSPPPASTAPGAAAAPAKPATPMPADLPSDVEGTLAAHASCKQKDCDLAAALPTISGLDTKGPAAVLSYDLAADSAVTFPRDTELDVVGVVIKGAVKVRSIEAQKGAPAKAWTAFYAPGGGLAIGSPGGPSRLIIAVVSGGDPVGDVVGHLKKDAAKLAWKQRPGPIDTVDLTAAKDLAWAGGAMHARLGIEGEGKRASLGVLMASKDASVAQHQHDTSWEYLGVLRAGGTMKRASAAGSTDLSSAPVADGAVVTVPKGVQHAWAPDGSKPLVAVQLYTPAGPEQRFKNLAAGK